LLEKENTKTSKELIKTFSYQKNLIESSIDGILGCDEKNVVVTFNQSMEKMLGYLKDEVLYKMTLEQFFSHSEAIKLKSKLNEKKYGDKDKLYFYETNILEKSGNKIPVRVSAIRLFDAENKRGYVFFFRDIRQIKKLEHEVMDQARILHQDKIMSLGRLAASVVHEINNPLSGILNYIRLMLRILGREHLSEERKKKFLQYLNIIENETERCSKIVSNILTFSRKSDPVFEFVRIDELLNRCILLSEHKLKLSNINLKTEIDTNIPLVKLDINQIQQCIINLIFNAIDAMHEGGTLKIEACFDEKRHIVFINVKDTGDGISEKHLPYIFEPFFTTKKEGYGVGLGLSTVYGIIERHKGTITVKSKQDETVFTIQLPVIDS
jgi:two-component system, NtrC family, sensor kinase